MGLFLGTWEIFKDLNSIAHREDMFLHKHKPMNKSSPAKLSVWSCLVWLYEHKQYCGLSLAISEYMMQSILSRCTKEEREKYKGELALIGIDVDHIEWGKALVAAWTKPTAVFGKSHASWNMVFSALQRLPAALHDWRGFMKWDAMLVEIFHTSNPMVVVTEIVKRIQELAVRPAPSEASHSHMARFLAEMSDWNNHKLIFETSREIYGFHWLELAFSALTLKMEEVRDKDLQSKTKFINQLLKDEYIYWKTWASRIQLATHFSSS